MSANEVLPVEEQGSYVVQDYKEFLSGKGQGRLMLSAPLDSTLTIKINQFYPTPVHDLFNGNDPDTLTIAVSKWKTYLDNFHIGELKSYVWLLWGQYSNTGWLYLLGREIAYRGDTLDAISRVSEGGCYERFPPYEWLLWSDAWVYGGEEVCGELRVVSFPR